MSDEQTIEVGDLVWHRNSERQDYWGPGIILELRFDVIDGHPLHVDVFHPSTARYGPQILKWYVADLTKKPSVLV